MVPENEKGKRVTRVTKGTRVRDSETTHYLLCPFMTFYALWYPRMKRSERVTRVRKVRDSETAWSLCLILPCL